VGKCLIIHGDSREELLQFENQIDLIITSPSYADAEELLLPLFDDEMSSLNSRKYTKVMESWRKENEYVIPLRHDTRRKNVH
jgi:DNA modification methylase